MLGVLIRGGRACNTVVARASLSTQQGMQRLALPALLCSTAAALLAPVTPSRRTVKLNGFFDDMMDKFVVADNDESKQNPPPPEPEKTTAASPRSSSASSSAKWKMRPWVSQE